MRAGQRFFEERVMPKIIIGFFIVVVSMLSMAQQERAAQESQSSPTDVGAKAASASPNKNRDAAVPSPDKYPFAQALKKLQADSSVADGSAGKAQSSRVPPVTVV